MKNDEAIKELEKAIDLIVKPLMNSKEATAKITIEIKNGNIVYGDIQTTENNSTTFCESNSDSERFEFNEENIDKFLKEKTNDKI